MTTKWMQSTFILIEGTQMTFSEFHVWAIVRLSSNMQTLVVNRFRRRSDAEECLRLFQRSMPNKSHTLVYSPPSMDLQIPMKPVSSDWLMYTNNGNQAVTSMMKEVQQELYFQPLPKVRSLLHEKIGVVAKQHPEIYDTEVRQAIIYKLAKWACQVHELPVSATCLEDFWDF